jgi:hypothetical protein
VTIVSQADSINTVAIPRPALGRGKWAVGATAAALIALACGRLWCVEGLLRPVTIDGPSMAPALCGKSYEVMCLDCGFCFRCDAEHVPTDLLAACPNCGYANNSFDTAHRMPADRVLIDRWPLLSRLPCRGDAVALKAPGGDLAVKRIAALPRQRIAIRSGDVYTGETLVRKTRQQLHALRLLVHDNDHRPQRTTGLPPRWRSASATLRWKADGSAFRTEPSAANSDTCDWLEYEHWPCTADTRTRGVASPITDNDPYNQGETRRPLNAVSDVLFTCRMRATSAESFVLAAIDGGQRFEAEIAPGRRFILRSGGQTLLDQPLTANFSRRPVEIEFGLFDQQVLLAAEGRVVALYRYDRPPGPRTETLHPLAIGARSGGLQIDNLCVWRDVYYLDPAGLSRPWQAATPLAADEFAVLGDNQPVSTDSRHWQPPGLPRRSMLGLVVKPFWAVSR